MIKNLDEIKGKSDIISIIGRHLTLQKAGVNQTACCPFHDEKSPSFTVNPRKQYFHCFGCGKSGDVFDFISNYLHLDFVEAVEYVAKEVGERVEFDQAREKSRADYQVSREAKDAQRMIVADVAKFYRVNTWGRTPPSMWEQIEIDGRVYKGETVEKFGICYAPQNALYRATVDTPGRFVLEHLVNAGLVKRNSENGGYFDHFSNRTLFPLYDPQGGIVGFTGRKQADSSPKSAKYKNSDDSPLYNKSKHLYGLYQTGNFISRADLVYIVEGQHDLITMYENGIENVVATSGTALTADHGRLITRYADIAVLMFDGDAAGIKAANRAVETLCGMLSLKVCILTDPDRPDDKIDPCDFIRKKGIDAFWEYTANHTQDAILWAIMKEYDANDLDKQQHAYQVAARILCNLTQLKRDVYLRELTTKKRMGNVRKMLEEAIDQYLSENAPARAFTNAQQDQISKFGIYVSNKQYFTPIDDGKGIPVSNFWIKSMLLIDGNASSERVIHIENIKGVSITSRIKSEIFTDLGAFKAWVEARGHFTLKVKAEGWNSIRDLVYDSMTVAYPITTLGHHREGFYTFKNGIFDGEVFQPANDLSVVQYNADHYLITASSNFDNVKADDGNERTVTSQSFMYKDVGHRYTLGEWGERLRDSYGTKTIAGMSYFMAALYRDILFERFTFFPHFNIFGVAGSGKNYFIESIMSAFGRVDPPVDLTSTTDKALPRIFGAVRNGLIWVDEYKNDLAPEMISALRGAYGASGRTTAEASMDNKTRRFQPRSGIIISGEHRPTKDPALYSRCCATETQSNTFSDGQRRRVDELRDLEQSGAYMGVTTHLLKYRNKIMTDYTTKYKEVRGILEEQTAGHNIMSRILQNWAVIATVPEILRDCGEHIPFKTHENLEFSIDRIIYQSSVIYQEDHLANFWRMVVYLLEDSKIRHNVDVIVQTMSSFKIWGKTSRDKVQYTTPDGNNAKFLFIRLTRVHPLYMQHVAMQSRSTGMAIGTLEHYITTCKWFIGKAIKRFDDQSCACFVLRLEEDFPVDFPMTMDIKETPFDPEI